MGGGPTVVSAPPPQRVGPSFNEQLELQKQAQAEARKEAERAAARAREAEELAYGRARETVAEMDRLTGQSVQQIVSGARGEYETKVPAITQTYQQKLASYDPTTKLAPSIGEAQKGIASAADLFTGKTQQAATDFGKLYQAGASLAGEQLKDYFGLAGQQQAEAAEKASGQQRLALLESAGLQQQAFTRFQQAAQQASRQGQRQMMAMTRNISNLYNPEFQRLATKPPTQRSTLLEETMAKQLYNV